MALRIDSDSPVPLYHQIAEAIRYRISTGDLKAGDTLPPLRTAAKRWGVNLHTVRRAYASLSEIGMVRIRRPSATVVTGSAPPSERPSAERARLQRFVQHTLAEGRTRYGLSPMQLARLLTSPPRGTGTGRVAVVECSDSQCEDLAAQLEDRWSIRAEPWCLSRSDDLPNGEIIATYFHYNELRQRWPSRLAKIHFVAIRPDESLPARVSARLGKRRSPEILVCEREPTMLSMIVSDLSGLFRPGHFALVPQLQKNPASLLSERDSRLRLVSPRMWGSLTAAQRSDPRVMEIRYLFDAQQIEQLADELHWPERKQPGEKTA